MGLRIKWYWMPRAETFLHKAMQHYIIFEIRHQVLRNVSINIVALSGIRALWFIYLSPSLVFFSLSLFILNFPILLFLSLFLISQPPLSNSSCLFAHPFLPPLCFIPFRFCKITLLISKAPLRFHAAGILILKSPFFSFFKFFFSLDYSLCLSCLLIQLKFASFCLRFSVF